ncbi:MAG TPA: hypothetical protein VK178_17195 [Opitutaceae bacterium]|nr:hypothetical protein [Opitutaceae bacterium]
MKILYDADFTRVPEMGHVVVKFTITNGTETELAWRATLVRNQYAYYSPPRFRGRGGSRPISYRAEGPAMTVPAHATREFVVPLGLITSDSGFLELDGPHLNETRLHFEPHRTELLADSRLPAQFFEAWETLSSPSAGKGRYRTGDDLLTQTVFPDDCRYYSGFRLVILRTTTWAELGSAQRGAFRGYVAAGGVLVFVSGDDDPFPVPAEFGIAAVIGARLPGAMYGLGSIDAIATEPAQGAAGAQGLAKRLDVSSVPPWLDPLPDWLEAKLPRAALILVLLATAFLAGPGALFWLAKRQQRHRLFLVLPAVAIGTSVVLVGLILLSDGTGGDGRRAVLAALVDGRPEMIVHQQQAVRCGFLLRGDFTVPAEARVEMDVPQAMAGVFVANRRGEVCSGDWFRNRSATVQTLVHTVPTRAGLEIRRDPAGGVPSVVSTFPAPLRDLVVFVGGKMWRTALAEPGQPVRLELDERDEERARMHLRSRLAGPFHRELDHLFQGTAMADRFFAQTDRLDGAPIPTLATIRWSDSVFVTGRVTEGGRP